MVKGPSELHPVFTVSLIGVAINHDIVKGAVACVQVFLRHPLFTQRSFFSETGISMLKTAVTAADVVWNSFKFDPSGAIGVEAVPVIADLKSYREKIVSPRKVVEHARERWFGAETVRSSAIGEAAPRTTVRFSDVVEVRDVNMLRSMISLVSLVAVALCQVPWRVERSECQWVLLLQRRTVFC